MIVTVTTSSVLVSAPDIGAVGADNEMGSDPTGSLRAGAIFNARIRSPCRRKIINSRFAFCRLMDDCVLRL
jgi:hypothetical protein